MTERRRTQEREEEEDEGMTGNGEVMKKEFTLREDDSSGSQTYYKSDVCSTS